MIGEHSATASVNWPTISGDPSFAINTITSHWLVVYPRFPSRVHEKLLRNELRTGLDLYTARVLTPVQRAYYVGFVACAVVCFTPFKLLTYALPVLLIAWLVVTAGTVGMRNRLVVVVGGAVGLGAFYELAAEDLLVTNYVLALITYSAILPVLVVESRSIASIALFEKQAGVALRLLAVEGVVGTIQAIYGATETGSFGGANGDHVAGTIHPYLSAELAFSNPVFAVNMAVMILACLAVPNLARRRSLSLALGGIALVLASVVHVLVFLVAAIAFALLTTRRTKGAPRRRLRVGRLAVVGALVAGVGYVALADNLEGISRVGAQAIDLDAVDIPRAILLSRVFSELPDDAPEQPYIGLGPGQFSSRASLIASGLYLGGPDSPRPVPLLSPQATRLASSYCFSLLVAYKESDLVIGSTEQPFFSMLSIYTELGIIGLAIVLGWLVVIIRRVQRRVRERPELYTRGLMFVTAVGFFTLIGLQDNYWESPQALLIGLLMLHVLYATIMYEPIDA